MRASAVAAMMLWCGSALAMTDGPHPPCETSPFPAYSAVDAPPAARVWNEAALRGWAPPACTGWSSLSFTSLVALAGRFHHRGGANELLVRFGAVSARRGIRYWSTADQAWLVLITDAAALDGPDAKRHRPDFSLNEMKAGAEVFFAQADNRSSGEIVYGMRLIEIGPDRIVVETRNVTPVKWHFVTLFPPDTLHAAYWMERQAPDLWAFYALSGITEGASWLAKGHEASSLSRAVAIYRHLVGVPTDREPPLAR